MLFRSKKKIPRRQLPHPPLPPADTTVCHSPRLLENEKKGVMSTNHGAEWHEYNNPDNIPLNGRVPKKKLGIRLYMGEVVYESDDIQNRYSPLDYFLMSFPLEQMKLHIKETNAQLRNARKRETTMTELYKVFGIVILITRFESTSRATFWSTVAQNKYIPAVKLEIGRAHV